MLVKFWQKGDLRGQSIESETYYIAKQDQTRIESGGIVIWRYSRLQITYSTVIYVYYFIKLDKILWTKVALTGICKSFNRVAFQVNDHTSSNKAHS